MYVCKRPYSICTLFQGKKLFWLLFLNKLFGLAPSMWKKCGVCGARIKIGPGSSPSVGFACESGSVLVGLCSRPPILEGQDVSPADI